MWHSARDKGKVSDPGLTLCYDHFNLEALRDAVATINRGEILEKFPRQPEASGSLKRIGPCYGAVFPHFFHLSL